MADRFLDLDRKDQSDALGVAATESGRPAHLFEKDVWVVWAVDALFSSHHGEYLVFKGGTSLSKGYNIIQRFSEDVDVTYDVRQLLPDLTKNGLIPATTSQARKWSDAIKDRLPAFVKDDIIPLLQKAAAEQGLQISITAEGENAFIAYDPDSTGEEYVARRVKLEFGARSTGEPAETKTITCDAAPYLSILEFPTAKPRLMLPKRTFWEKATAVHVYCKNGDVGDRHSRHWYDLTKLDEHGIADEAFADRALGSEVAAFKNRFFRMKGVAGAFIDYDPAITGHLQLVPNAEIQAALQEDYAKMVGEGILIGDAESFEELMQKCADLEARANRL